MPRPGRFTAKHGLVPQEKSRATFTPQTPDTMYTPPAFAEPRPEVLLEHVESRPFGILVTAGPASGGAASAGAASGGLPSGGLLATHIPFVVERGSGARGTLVGHLARANPQAARAPAAGAGTTDGTTDALVIFPGPEAYVTPGWYPSKQEHGRAVPTWNYVAVHVHGTLRYFDDRARLLAHLDSLTLRHEAGRERPWALADAPEEYVHRLVGEIVGVEVEITRLEGAWKLSQNRPAADIEGVIRGLAASPAAGDQEVARLVAERRPPSKRPDR